MNKVKNKTLNIILLVFVGLLICGFILGSFFDLDIASKVFEAFPFKSTKSINAPLLAVILSDGIIVTSMFATFGGTLVFTRKFKSIFWNIFFKLFAVATVLYIAWSTYDSCLESATIYQVSMNDQSFLKIWTLFAVIIADLLSVVFALAINKEVDEKDKFWVGCLLIALVGLYMVSNESIKNIFSRPRPRTIFAEGATETFKSWWIARPSYAHDSGVGSAAKSFTSGHAAHCGNLICMSLLCCSLIKDDKKRKTWSIIATIFFIVFSVAICGSRIFAQAHFLTDVCGGMIIMLLLDFLVMWIIPRVCELLEKVLFK